MLSKAEHFVGFRFRVSGRKGPLVPGFRFPVPGFRSEAVRRLVLVCPLFGVVDTLDQAGEHSADAICLGGKHIVFGNLQIAEIMCQK